MDHPCRTTVHREQHIGLCRQTRQNGGGGGGRGGEGTHRKRSRWPGCSSPASGTAQAQDHDKYTHRERAGHRKGTHTQTQQAQKKRAWSADRGSSACSACSHTVAAPKALVRRCIPHSRRAKEATSGKAKPSFPRGCRYGRLVEGSRGPLVPQHAGLSPIASDRTCSQAVSTNKKTRR